VLRPAAGSSRRSAVRDSLIIVHGMPVVTRNVADFAPAGVEIIGPWQPLDEGA
jgi:hypothetical protein